MINYIQKQSDISNLQKITNSCGGLQKKHPSRSSGVFIYEFNKDYLINPAPNFSL